MESEGTFVPTYKHQYRILTIENDTPKEIITDWQEVSEQFFQENANYMGMEIAAKDSTGKVSRTAAPPGYSNYVGNPRYGHWASGSGGTFWEFYGKYAMMSSIFNMMTYPAYRDRYSDYRSNYYGSRPYYGRSRTGSQLWGTSGASTTNRTNSKWSKASSRTNAFSSKSSRTGSRFSSSFSSRSRSGGFGK